MLKRGLLGRARALLHNGQPAAKKVVRLVAPLVTVIGNVPATVRRAVDQVVVQVAGQTLRYRQTPGGWQRE